ncbi:unnamed protein product [Larinioides sclopetarius]|uniref:Uncharacterized protein n=1 Tax=Larinioides sclopetarius TaxID=280406 RepID=A0AAV1ZTW3_9ARAC
MTDAIDYTSSPGKNKGFLQNNSETWKQDFVFMVGELPLETVFHLRSTEYACSLWNVYLSHSILRIIQKKEMMLLPCPVAVELKIIILLLLYLHVSRIDVIISMV